MRINDRFLEHGLTPSHLIAKIRGVRLPSVLANSIPKCGTNLLIRVFILIFPYHRPLLRTLNQNNLHKLHISQNKFNSVIPAHLDYETYSFHKSKFVGLRSVLIVRDPRDMLVSNIHYLKKDKKHRLHNYFNGLSFKDSVMAVVDGLSKEEIGLECASKGVVEMYEDYSAWVRSNECLVVRFEDLVGVAGGGNSNTQFAVLSDMFDYVGLSVNNQGIKLVQEGLFGKKSRTFRKGLIGSWSNELDSDDKFFVNERLGDILNIYGYTS